MKRRRIKIWSDPTAVIVPEPESYPPPTFPAVRLSLVAFGERWQVALIKGEFRTTWTVETAGEAKELAEELIAEAGNCNQCGAPLWRTANDRVVCSRHWAHCPQPDTEVYRPQHTRWRIVPPKRQLPEIKHAPLPPKRANRLAAAWRRWEKASEQLMEVVETIGPDGRRIIRARYRAENPVDARRLLTKIPRIAARRTVRNPTPAPETDKYLEYVGLMQRNNLAPYPFEAWVENYRAAQSRK